MRVFAQYFGLMVFGFVVFVAGLVALPPNVAAGEFVGLGLAFLVITGGFGWFLSADLAAGPGR